MWSAAFSLVQHTDFKDWRLCTISHVGIFDPALGSLYSPLLPLSPSLGYRPPPPRPKYSTYGQRVAGRGGVLETILCRSFLLCFWPDLEPTKFLDHPKTIPRRGGGLRQINTCRKVPFQVTFLEWQYFALLNISISQYCSIYNILNISMLPAHIAQTIYM